MRYVDEGIRYLNLKKSNQFIKFYSIKINLLLCY
jgi:hypothetical protein